MRPREQTAARGLIKQGADMHPIEGMVCDPPRRIIRRALKGHNAIDGTD
jgi:hypothetical protein